MTLIRQLEDLAFGTRLRLLTERIQQEGAKVYKYLNIDFEPRWFALFYLLNERSPLAVTEAASMLGVSQPAITQTAGILIGKSLVKTAKEKKDTRKRLLTLTEKGKKLAVELAPVWKAFDEATQDLFKDTGFDVMLVINRLEHELEKKDLYTRITEKVKESQSNEVEILAYKPEYRSAFKELNYEWLNKYFKVETADRKLLTDPETSIIEPGGYIFFGKLNDEIVGTAALIRHSGKTFELAKMAVTEKAQGKQIGKKLAITAIEKARSKKAKMIYLHTSRKLVTALNLYRSLGFEQVESENNAAYERPTIKMELVLE